MVASRFGVCLLACVVVCLAMSASALAAPITIDFESGASVGDQITNQYAAPGGVPEGPTFRLPTSAGFTTPFACGPGHLSNVTAHSGSNSVVLDGCGGGSEFAPTATFFSMGYTTDSVSFWVAIGAGILNGSSETVVTTPFDSSHHPIPGEQVVTTFGPQSGPTFQQVTVSSTSFNIAFVAVEFGTQGGDSSSPTGVYDPPVDLNSAPLYLDDLTYDPPATPPGSSFVIGATPGASGTIDGGQAQVTIPITWFNNPTPSAYPVTLSASTPAGVSASFSPTTTTTGTSTLTLTVSTMAPQGQWNITVTGTSGSETEQVVIPFGVSAAFEPVSPGKITVLPCTTKQVPLSIQTGAGFTQSITLFVTTANQQGVSITGISGNGGLGTVSDPTDASVTVTPVNGLATATLTVAAGAGSAPYNGPQVIGLDAASSGYADSFTNTGTLAVGTSQVGFVSTPSGPVRTPQVLQPGTPVTITGQGFCSGSTVQFGNAKAVAVPTAVTGTTIQVSVPRLATNGPVSVLTGSPAVSSPPSTQSLTIDSYRNTNAWAFHNYTPTGFDLGELSDLFGVGQVFFSINPCWPFGTCNIPLFPYPISGIMLAVADGALTGSHGGACFGFSLSSQRILEGQVPFNDFPSSGPSISAIDSPAGPSAFTTRYINTQAMAQFSRDYLDQYLAAILAQANQSATSAVDSVRNQVATVLQRGRYPLIALRDNHGGGGHVVVGYDIENVGPHEYYIDVYDSNDPFGWNGSSTVPSAELAADGQLHQANVEGSRIHVMPDGSWSLPSTGFNGDQASIIVSDPASIPVQPSMPNSLPGSGFYFGSAAPAGQGSSSAPPPSRTTQLTGAGGRTLYGSGGRLNSNPATRLDAAPFAPAVGAAVGRPEMFVLGRGASDFRQTVVGTGAGTGSYTLVESGLLAQIGTRMSKGVADQLTLQPSVNRIGFSSAAGRAPVTLTLIGASSGAVHTATIATTSFRGAGDTMSFNGSRSSLTFVHRGAATTFTLALSTLEHNGAPSSFVSGPVPIGRGQTARITGVGWSSLGTRALRVRIGTRTLTLFNRLHVAQLARISRLRTTGGRHGALSLAITARLARLPRGAVVAFVWLVRSRGHLVATHALPVTAGFGRTLTRTWTFKPRRGSRYQLTARVLVLAPRGPAGATSSSATSTASFAGR